MSEESPTPQAKAEPKQQDPAVTLKDVASNGVTVTNCKAHSSESDAFVLAEPKQQTGPLEDFHGSVATEPKQEHQLYETGDRGVPSSVLDSNGEVVLGLCKKCGLAEQQLLDQPKCEPKQERRERDKNKELLERSIERHRAKNEAKDKQIAELKAERDRLNNKVNEAEYIRMRFCDIVPNVVSRSWEDIWERVREALLGDQTDGDDG